MKSPLGKNLAFLFLKENKEKHTIKFGNSFATTLFVFWEVTIAVSSAISALSAQPLRTEIEKSGMS